jgi:5-methylcytosine-specific restriction endonuclease McrA
MAGDWIKMRSNLWDDPRVARLCDMTDSTEAAVVGGLYWLWAAADQHSEDGVMPGLTTRAIDRKTGIAGLGDALVSIGWLADHPEGVRITHFEEHNGNSAKSRSETAKRVALHRAKNGPDADLPASQEGKRALIPKPIRTEVMARHSSTCVYCGRKEGVVGQNETKRYGYMHIDHVIPISRNGANDASNMVVAFTACNMFKADRTPDECGLAWPVNEKGDRIGNTKSVTQSLQAEHTTVTDALAREREREEKDIKTKSRSKAEATQRGTRLPADWSPSSEDIEFCRAERPDLKASDVASQFRDYWLGIAGSKGCKMDWSATWRNWTRNQRAPNARAGPVHAAKFDPLAYVNRNRMETKQNERTIDLNELGEPV